MSKTFTKYITFKNVVALGVLITLGITFSEVVRGVDRNFQIFSLSTQDFWSGIAPYGEQWWRHGLDFFLYPPTFNVLFTPFAYLPSWLGGFVWNLFNFSMLAWAVWLLPHIGVEKKKYLLLALLPIVATSVISFQYNMVVAYIFLFAFVLFEKGNGPWAMLLIMVSLFTKIYGGAELLIILFYPKFWRNMAWGAIWATMLFLLPALKTGFSELIPYYGTWLKTLGSHMDSRPFETFFDIKLFWSKHPDYMQMIQAGVFAVVTILTFAKIKYRTEPFFRIGVLAVIMGYVILFGNSSEKHTYVIALAGFYYWWQAKTNKTEFDKILFWTTLTLLSLVPIDIICPPVVMRFLFDTLDLNKWLFTLVWGYLCYQTFFKTKQIKN